MRRTILIAVIVLSAALMLHSVPAYATAGVWSSSGNEMYYNDGAVGIGVIPLVPPDPNAIRRLQVEFNPGGIQLGHTTLTKMSFVGNGNAGTGSNYTYRTTYIGNSYNGAMNTGTATNIGLEVYVTGSDKNYSALFNGGNVGIGTYAPQYALSVNGTVQAKQVIVNTGWSDYVFENDYNLMSLPDVESFIKEHKHLPDIVSAADVKANGVELGKSQSDLLRKIEELTLYVIEQNKRVTELEAKLSDSIVTAK